MGKSKHRKSHQKKLNTYKANKKKEQEVLKKKMMDNYIKMQEQMMEDQQAHRSTEEVAGPQIDIDDLNIVDEIVPDFETIDLEDIDVDIEDAVVVNEENN